MSTPAKQARPRGPLTDEDALALTQLLQDSLGRGFRLVVIEVATLRQRKRTVVWLRGRLEVLKGELIDLDVRSLPGENLCSELAQHLDHAAVDRKRLILAMHGLQATEGGQPDELTGLYLQLNTQRDQLVRELGCFWVLLIDPDEGRKLQDIAPDFCALASLWLRAPEDALVPADDAPPSVHHAAGSRARDDTANAEQLRQRHEAIEAGHAAQAHDHSTHPEPSADAQDEHQAHALLHHGQLELQHGNLDAAERAAEQALAWGREQATRAMRMTTRALALLSLVHEHRGDYQQARTTLEQALEVAEQHYGADHPEIVSWLVNLARIHLTLANKNEARRLLERARAIEAQPSAATLQQLAWLACQEDDFDAAQHALEQALQLEHQRLGTQLHPDIAAILVRLASVDRLRGDLEAAVGHIERAIELQTTVFGTRINPGVAASLRELGGVLRERGELERAQKTLERSLSIEVQLLGTQAHPRVTATLDQLACVRRDRGDLDGAQQLLEHAVNLTILVFGTELHLLVAEQLGSLALTLAQRGDLAQAIATLERALTIHTHIHGPDHPSTCATEVELAKLLLDQGDRARAATLLQHARPILAEARGPTHELVQRADQLIKACSRTPSA